MKHSMKFFSIHPENPQERLVRQAGHLIRNGGLVVYPTDSGYAFGCKLDNIEALKRIRQIRQLGDKHFMTLVCRDLSQVGTYANIHTTAFRLIKAFTPGPYTFLLQATRHIPKKMVQPNRKTIGIRIPDHPVVWSLLEVLGEPIISTTLTLPQIKVPLTAPEAIRDILGQKIDLLIDVGPCNHEPTTVVDLTRESPRVLREGKGDPTPFKGLEDYEHVED